MQEKERGREDVSFHLQKGRLCFFRAWGRRSKHLLPLRKEGGGKVLISCDLKRGQNIHSILVSGPGRTLREKKKGAAPRGLLSTGVSTGKKKRNAREISEELVGVPSVLFVERRKRKNRTFMFVSERALEKKREERWANCSSRSGLKLSGERASRSRACHGGGETGKRKGGTRAFSIRISSSRGKRGEVESGMPDLRWKKRKSEETINYSEGGREEGGEVLFFSFRGKGQRSQLEKTKGVCALQQVRRKKEGPSLFQKKRKKGSPVSQAGGKRKHSFFYPERGRKRTKSPHDQRKGEKKTLFSRSNAKTPQKARLKEGNNLTF